MKRILAISTALTIISSGLNYITQIIITEIAGFEIRAQVEIISSVITLSSSIFSFNVYLALTLYSKKYNAPPSNLKKIITRTTFLQVVGAVLIYEITVSNILTLNYISSITLILVAIALNNYGNIITALMSGMQIFLKPKLITAIAALITLLLIGAFSVLGYQGEDLLIYFGALSTLIISGLMFGGFSNNKSSKTCEIEFTIKKAALDFWPVYVISIAQIFSNKAYFLYLTKKEPLEYIGELVFSLSIIQILLLPTSILAALIIAKSERKQFNLMLRKVCSAYLLLAVVGYTFLYFDFNKYFYLKSFQSEGFISNTKLLVLTLPFSAASTIAISYCISKKYFPKKIIYSQCVALPVVLFVYEFLNILDIPRAAALAFAISNIIVSISTVASLKR